MKPFKKICEDYYQRPTLNSEQIETLMQLHNSCPKSGASIDGKLDEVKVPDTRKILQFTAIAASVGFVLLFGWIFSLSQPDIQDRIAKEIVYNHGKVMKLEVESTEFEKIAQHFSSLDFRLIDSLRRTALNWRLAGGRHCSIQGKPAAQLRLFKPSEQSHYTYYQAAIPAGLNLHGETYSRWINGIYVELWVESGVLLGLAGYKAMAY